MGTYIDGEHLETTGGVSGGGRQRDEMIFDSLGYKHTNQEGKKKKNRIDPHWCQLKGQGHTGLSKKLITLPFINH